MKKFSKLDEKYGVDVYYGNNPDGITVKDLLDYIREIPMDERNKKILLDGKIVTKFSYDGDDIKFD